MRNLLNYNDFDKINESNLLNLLKDRFFNLYNKVSKIFKRFGKDVFEKAKQDVEKHLNDYSLESIRDYCSKFGLSFNIFQQLYGVREEFSFKKILVLPILALLLLASCKGPEAFDKGIIGESRVKEINLEAGKKLVDVDWRTIDLNNQIQVSLWFLTRNMVEGETPQKYEYETDGEDGYNYKIIIIEHPAAGW